MTRSRSIPRPRRCDAHWLGAGDRRPRRRRDADRYRASRGDLSGAATYGPDAGSTRHVCDQAVLTGRHGSRRVALGYRSEHAFYTGVADKIGSRSPGILSLRDLRTAPISCCCSPTWPPPNRATRSRLHGGRGGARGARAGRFARPEVVRPGMGGPTGVAMPMPGDADAAKGLGDVATMAADTSIARLGADRRRDQETWWQRCPR